MPQLHAEVQTLSKLSLSTKADMYTLYSRHYAACSEENFSSDLSSKTHVLLLHDQQNTLQGFTSLARYTHSFDNQACQIVYSGDTIIHSDFWGEQTLPQSWIELTGVFKSEHPKMPLYWFLIVKGHRTYRYLSIFSKQYFPHPENKTPKAMQDLLDGLAKERFPEHYQASSGLIQFPESRGHLSDEFSDIPPNALKRKEVQFFLERNPGYTHGDELACITELSMDNLTRRARVYFEKGLATC